MSNVKISGQAYNWWFRKDASGLSDDKFNSTSKIITYSNIKFTYIGIGIMMSMPILIKRGKHEYIFLYKDVYNGSFLWKFLYFSSI